MPKRSIVAGLGGVRRGAKKLDGWRIKDEYIDIQLVDIAKLAAESSLRENKLRVKYRELETRSQLEPF